MVLLSQAIQCNNELPPLATFFLGRSEGYQLRVWRCQCWGISWPWTNHSDLDSLLVDLFSNTHQLNTWSPDESLRVPKYILFVTGISLRILVWINMLALNSKQHHFCSIDSREWQGANLRTKCVEVTIDSMFCSCIKRLARCRQFASHTAHLNKPTI